MSTTAKTFFSLFVLLALIAVGHDIYVWRNANGFPFAFATLGWSFKTYLPDEYLVAIDMLGTDTFNAILTPILKIPAAFLAGGIAVGIYAIDFISRKVKALTPGRGKDRDQRFKKYK